MLGKYCENCGIILKISSKSCPRCGSKLSLGIKINDGTNNIYESPDDAYSKEPTKKDLNWLWSGLAILVAVLFFHPNSLANIPTISRLFSTKKIPKTSSVILNNSSDKFDKNLQLIESHYDEGDYYVTGSIKNISSKTYSHISVLINLYDKSNALVGEAYADISDVDPGRVWKFKAYMLTTEKVTSYKIKKITGH